MNRPKILIVDDEPIVRKFLVRLLEECGYIPYEARTVDEGISITKGVDLDLVIIDLKMPDGGGLSFLERRFNKKVPVIVLSAFATRDNVIGTIQRGASYFVNKGDFNESKFLERVRSQLGKDVSVASSSRDQASKQVTTKAVEPVAAPKVTKLSEIEVEKKIKAMRDIKALPFVATEIMKMTDSKATSAKDLVDVIMRDQAIASKILRLANSAFYKTSKRIQSLEQAVGNIGFSAVRDIALGISIIDNYMNDRGGLNRYEFWRNAITCGLFCKRIAEAAHHDDVDTAFLSGLLHRIGCVLFDEHFPAEYRAMLDACSNGGCVEASESTIFGMTHAELAAQVLEAWGFREDLRDAIVYYKVDGATLSNLRSRDQRLIATTSFASVLTDISDLSDCAFESVRLPDQEIVEFSGFRDFSRLPKIFEEVRHEVRDMEGLILLHDGGTIPSRPSRGNDGKRHECALTWNVENQGHLSLLRQYLDNYFHVVKLHPDAEPQGRFSTIVLPVFSNQAYGEFTESVGKLKVKFPDKRILVIARSQYMNHLRDEQCDFVDLPNRKRSLDDRIMQLMA